MKEITFNELCRLVSKVDYLCSSSYPINFEVGDAEYCVGIGDFVNNSGKDIDVDIDKELNEEFNEVYDAISDAYDKLNEFYMKHCALGQNDIENTRIHFDVVCLFDKLGNCKENAHEIAEYFTWDN